MLRRRAPPAGQACSLGRAASGDRSSSEGAGTAAPAAAPKICSSDFEPEADALRLRRRQLRLNPQLRCSSGAATVATSGRPPVAAAASPAAAIAPTARPAAPPPQAADHGCQTGRPERTSRRLQLPPPRMIVPQTGPRPVYKAPLRPARLQALAPGAPAGATMRPAPGRPVPGQPIFQRPRPGAPTRIVRRCVRASAGRCIPRGSRPRAHVRWEWGREQCLPEGRRPGRAAGRAHRHAGRDSAMCPAV